MRRRSVPALLADVGAPVVAGDANTITYRLGKRTVATDLIVIEHLTSSAAVFDDLRRRPRRLLIVCSTITSEARTALLNSGLVDLCVWGAGELVLSGRVFRIPNSDDNRRAVTGRKRGRRAAERVCVLTRNHLRQQDIAGAVGITQQAVSLMTEKEPLPDTPMPPAERRTWLTAMSTVPADDGLIEAYWYGAEPAVKQAIRAIQLGNELAVRVRAGGEVAADTLRPWRVPTRGLVYSEELIDLTQLDLVGSTAAEATLTVRVPTDRTAWRTAAWWQSTAAGERQGIPTMDPVVVLQDLNAGPNLGDDAQQLLADWIVAR